MAVVRVKANTRWFHRAAEKLKPTHPRGARELNRAADRRGKLAELTAAEARALAEAMPEDEAAVAAAQRATALEAHDAAALKVRRARVDAIRRRMSE